MDSGLDHFAPIAPLEFIEAVEDERGRLIEPIPRGLLPSGRVQHLHTISFTPGAVRGNHVHRLQIEEIVLLAGTILARVEDLTTGAAAELMLDRPCRIELRPGVAHAFRGAGDALMLSYADRPYEPEDTQPHVLFE